MPKVTNPLKVAIAGDTRTQKEIGADVGLSETQISKIAAAPSHADDATKQALADTLGKSVDELFPPIVQAEAA